MRSVQSLLGCYTTRRLRRAVYAISFAFACAALPPLYLASLVWFPETTDGDNWIGVVAALAGLAVVGTYALTLAFESAVVTYEDLSALSGELRWMAHVQQINPMKAPLDWGELRKLGDKLDLLAFDAAMQDRARSEAANQRLATEEDN